MENKFFRFTLKGVVFFERFIHYNHQQQLEFSKEVHLVGMCLKCFEKGVYYIEDLEHVQYNSINILCNETELIHLKSQYGIPCSECNNLYYHIKECICSEFIYNLT